LPRNFFTFNRPAALALTLAGLVSQSFNRFNVTIADQTDNYNVDSCGEVAAVTRVLQAHDHQVAFHKNLPRRGMAQQRNFLLDQVRAPYALFLDDDLILENYVIYNLVQAIIEENCGYVGGALTGLSYAHDVRPHEQQIEFWQGPVIPETIRPDSPAWNRYHLHNAANIYHVAQRLGLSSEHPRKYHVAWVGGCVLYDTEKLRSIGGFLLLERPARCACR
jgi:GT2 family glycosyltransferase